MTVLDTSALVRFFTKDDVDKSRKVKRLLESGEETYVPDAVFVELQFVLQKFYGLRRKDISKSFQFLALTEKIKTTFEAKLASKLFVISPLSITDCFVEVYAQGQKLASFDKQLLKISKAVSYWSK